jgi:hypothetical protein
MSSGQTLEVQGIVGEIRAGLARGNEVEVVAVKRGRRGLEEVAVEVAEAGNRTVICAVYGSWRHGQGTCHPDFDDRGRWDDEGRRKVDIDVEVEYEVRLPAGVDFEATIVSGDIEATGLRSNVEASTVDGEVHIQTSGQAWAHSVAGDIEVEMGDFGGDLEFESVSGDILLWLPRDFSADVDFSSLTGDLRSDFDLDVEYERKRRWIGSSVEGTIGGGGRDLNVATVSGNVELRRRGR